MTRTKRNPKAADRYREQCLAAYFAGIALPAQPARLSVAEARKIRATVRDLVRAS